MPPRRPQFFISIFTAMVVGVGIAYSIIFTIQLVEKPQIISSLGSSFTRLSGGISESVISRFSSLSHTIKGLGVKGLFSEHFVYEAQAEEDASHDMTFIGENLTAAVSQMTTSEIVGVSDTTISALAFSVQSLDKDNVLIEKDAERSLPIASITKLITAVVARKVFNGNDIVTITQRVLNTEGTSGNLKLNERYKIKDIIYPMLMVSSNDAAEAISQGYDLKHGTGAFVKEMNAWVSEVGAYRTYFKDASGLSPQNVSTARDLSLIAKWITQNEPDILDITLTKTKTVGRHTWTNPTHFLSFASYSGGKNGFIPESQQTNVSIFKLGFPKRLYSVVLLGSKDRDKDTLSVLNTAVK